MSTKTLIGGIAVIALILGAFLFGIHSSPAPTMPASGAVGGVAGSGLLSPLGTSYVYPNVSNYNYFRGQAVEADLLLDLGGYSTTTTGYGSLETFTNQSCTNAASSTIFAVQNPFAATSTAEINQIVIGGNATTSSLAVGTSTTPNGSASTNAFVNSTNGIASSTVQWIIGGQTAATDQPGMIAATSNLEITVAPSQYVVGFSTSTATGAGAAQYSPNYSTCQYQILWFY